MDAIWTRRLLKLALYSLGGLVGLAITIYGFYAWSSALLPSGTYSSVTDPIMEPQNRRLTIFWLILFGFCNFGFMQAWGRLPGSRSPKRDTNI